MARETLPGSESGRWPIRSRVGGAVARVLRGHPSDLGLLQHPTCFVQQGGAGIGEGDAPLGAVEETHAQLLLELADLLADRRLGDVQALRRAAEVQFLSDGDEVPEMPKFHCAGSSYLRGPACGLRVFRDG